MPCRAQSESLVRQTLPRAQTSSQDQYGITAPQIQTLTVHYIAPVPLQARQGTDGMCLLPYGAKKRAENEANVTHRKRTMRFASISTLIQHFNPKHKQI